MEIKEKKVKQSFKEYYQSNPIFRASHLKKLAEQVQCESCNKSVSRSHLSKHNRTHKHIKNSLPKKEEVPVYLRTDDDMLERIKNIEKYLKTLNENFNIKNLI